jgi:hypothetical protein
MAATQASGKIKIYQAVVGGLLLLILPISYLFLELGFPPQTTLYISISISVVALFARLKIVSPLVGLSIFDYTRHVLFRIFLIALVSIIIPLIFKFYIHQEVIRFFTVSITSVLSAATFIYLIGLKKEEKHFLNNMVLQFFVKIRLR